MVKDKLYKDTRICSCLKQYELLNFSNTLDVSFNFFTNFRENAIHESLENI